MFDVWRGIDEEGEVAVPVKESALSALGWVEVDERYPELVPEKFDLSKKLVVKIGIAFSSEKRTITDVKIG